MVREILDDKKCPFKKAWDLKLRRLYFYKTKLRNDESIDFGLTTESDVPWAEPPDKKKEEVIKLNTDKKYV